MEEFRLLREIINRFCGIFFMDESRILVARRLRDRLEALGIEDFQHYLRHLRFHPDSRAELETIADVLTTNETYFFREDYQLRAFVADIVPDAKKYAAANGSKRLVVWSAGCSTGEEAYTIAILLQSSGLVADWDVRVFGSDLSRQVLHVARKGVYRGASFRALPEAYERYFQPCEGGREVRPEIRAMCRFGHLNLLDTQRTAIVGQVDVIFCRNTLIYFDMESRKRVIESFYERLRPGGYLLLGHSESLLNVSTAFEVVHVTGEMVYRKPVEEVTMPMARALRRSKRPGGKNA